MIITLIGIGLLFLAIICLVCCEKCLFSYNVDEFMSYIGIILCIAGISATLISGTIIGCANISVDSDIYTAKLEYDAIVKQAECINSDYEDVSKAEVIQRVYEWNRKVYTAKYWSSNPLTNWFWNKKYVDSLEYIELED